jgi:3D (Asp-Asp-Asp) domain-containing protein
MAINLTSLRANYSIFESRDYREILLSEKIKIESGNLIGTKGGQCVSFIQEFMGLLDNCHEENCYKLSFRGSAINIEPNSDEPKIGNVVLFTDSIKGHAAIIADIIDGDLILLESNFNGDEKITFGRVVEMNNPENTNQKNKIRGYYDFSKPDASIIADVTGYSSTKDQTDSTPFITASGERVRDGIIACPRKYEFGTRFKIDDKTYICEDRMNIRFDDRFDIWFPSRELAVNYGIQKKEITLLK